MITFTKQPVGTLNLDGSTEGIKQPEPAPNIGIPTPDFHNQVIGLANEKVPIEKVHQAIDTHPEITDKGRAKEMASAVYDIIGKK